MCHYYFVHKITADKHRDKHMLLESGVHKAITRSISTLCFLLPQFFSGVFQDVHNSFDKITFCTCCTQVQIAEYHYDAHM